jgi:hypothetical protein
MGRCLRLLNLIRARYNMKADVYIQSTTRDPDTRQFIRTWSFSETVLCQARSVASQGIKTVGSTESTSGAGVYEDEDYLRLRCSKSLSKRVRIRNVRNKAQATGDYTEDDSQQQQEEFEVTGVQPSVDPFGRVVEYEILCEKVQDE